MSNGSTSKLTPGLAVEVVLLRSKGKSYTEICKSLRQRPEKFKISPPDITHWKHQHRTVELNGEERDFAQMMAQAEELMTDCAASEMVEIADAAQEDKEPDHITKHRLNARRWAHGMRMGQQLQLSGKVEGGGVKIVQMQNSLLGGEE